MEQLYLLDPCMHGIESTTPPAALTLRFLSRTMANNNCVGILCRSRPVRRCSKTRSTVPAEAHHIQPLGSPHDGSYIRENILCCVQNIMRCVTLALSCCLLLAFELCRDTQFPSCSSTITTRRYGSKTRSEPAGRQLTTGNVCILDLLN